MKRRHALGPIALLLLTMPLAAQAETREPSAREIASFDAWYRRQHAGAAAAKPRFDIRRESGAGGWRIHAMLDGPPQRGAWSLCSAARQHYVHDARARSEGARWSEATPPQRLVWLDRAADCGTVAGRVQLKQALPDRQIVTLLEQQAQLLANARLLFAGNSRCAVQRAHAFQLESIDIGPDRLYRLAYLSDRGGRATVSVRQRGRELTAWNVNC